MRDIMWQAFSGAASCMTLFFVCSMPVLAENETSTLEIRNEGTGAWSRRAHDAHGQTCMQRWACGPSDDIRVPKDHEVLFSADATTKGQCKARGNLSCRTCDAPQPATACTWRLDPPYEPPK